MIKAIIFDVDGVLINTVNYHYRAWKKLFTRLKISFSFEDYILKVNGLPRKIGITNIRGKTTVDELERLSTEKQEYFLNLVQSKNPQPLPGVVPFLDALKKEGFILSAASSSKNAPLLLKKTGIDKYFSVIISGHDFTRPKPNPEIFLKASKKIKVLPANCVVIEDALLGIMAAKKAGMISIGILTSKDYEIQKSADITFNSLKSYKSVLKFIKKSN